LYLLTHNTPESVNVHGEQPTFRFSLTTRCLLIVDPPNGPLTHFLATVTELLRALVLTLDFLLEPGIIIIMIREFVAKSLYQSLFQDLVQTPIAS
jgi:hypothetical protein